MSLLSEDLEWQSRAVCIGLDPEMWFPERGQSSRRARDICADCPVRIKCLRYALETNQDFGMWGGTTERERRFLKKPGLSDDDLAELTARIPLPRPIAPPPASEPLPGVVEYRQCHVCMQRKPLTEAFSMSGHGAGRRNVCKPCAAKRRHDAAYGHMDKVRAERKARAS